MNERVPRACRSIRWNVENVEAIEKKLATDNHSISPDCDIHSLNSSCSDNCVTVLQLIPNSKCKRALRFTHFFSCYSHNEIYWKFRIGKHRYERCLWPMNGQRQIKAKSNNTNGSRNLVVCHQLRKQTERKQTKYASNRFRQRLRFQVRDGSFVGHRQHYTLFAIIFHLLLQPNSVNRAAKNI